MTSISWGQLGVLLGPFTAAYLVLLAYRAASVANDNTGVLFDRYSLGLLLVALICLVREFQDRIQPRFSLVSAVFIVIMAAYGVAITHNTFALYRARVAMAAELRAANSPEPPSTMAGSITLASSFSTPLTSITLASLRPPVPISRHLRFPPAHVP